MSEVLNDTAGLVAGAADELGGSREPQLQVFDNSGFQAILRAKNNKELCRPETEQIFLILASYLGLVSFPTAVNTISKMFFCNDCGANFEIQKDKFIYIKINHDDRKRNCKIGKKGIGGK